MNALTTLALMTTFATSFAASAIAPPNIVLNWYEDHCIGGDNSLLSTGLWLSYEANSTAADDGVVQQYRNKVWIDYNVTEQELMYYKSEKPRNVSKVNYYFNQPEHGGGGCYCVRISFKTVGINSFVSLCNGKPNRPRRINLEWPPTSPLRTNMDFNDKMKDIPFGLDCSGERNYVSISFHTYTSQDCPENGRFESQDEIEFSIRYSSNPAEWIPISLTVIRPISTEYIREYRVPEVIRVQADVITEYNFKICNHSIADPFQLRWLAYTRLGRQGHSDTWSLDNLNVDLHFNNEVFTAVRESFNENYFNDQYWTPYNIRNGRLANMCSKEQSSFALWFGDQITLSLNQDVTMISHAAVTNGVSPINIICEELQSIQPVICTVLEQNDTVNISNSSFEKFEQNITQMIVNSNILLEILFNQDTSEAVRNIEYVANIMPIMAVYLLKTLLNNVHQERNLTIVQNAVSTGTFILQQPKFQPLSSIFSESAIVGPTLLLAMDKLIFLPNSNFKFLSNAIIAKAISVPANQSTYIFSTIGCEGWDPPFASISIPIDHLLDFASNDTIKIFLSVYRDMAAYLPEGLPELPGSELASDILGSSLLCESEICPTGNLSLARPVNITFHHSDTLIEKLNTNSSLTTVCVFLQIQTTESEILRQGHWSQRGCTTRISSTSRTVCECNHLTHFAILLSAKPPNFGSGITLSLTAIGYIGVIVSLVSMGTIIVVFILLKTQRGFRGYIHINLCISLSVAQILFIAGVDKTGRPEDGVPTHCKVIAVLLHYFFLTSFMWMLMEGVFLYFALVKVFMTNTKKYMMVFTVLSYGIPLLYMGLLTVPLGFGLSETHYGYKEACFLRPDGHFILAFILPIIIIFVINIGFLVMGSVILWKQQKKRISNTESSKILGWVKAVISLTVVMGLTWIIGLLVVELEELAPVAYIYTIAVAFQGFFILLVLVVFTEAVRNDLKAVFFRRSEKIMNKIHASNMTEETVATSSGKDYGVTLSEVNGKKKEKNVELFGDRNSNEIIVQPQMEEKVKKKVCAARNPSLL